MKKFLTLVLALVLALGLAAPALAFTSDDSEAEEHPFDLSIYLVEYDDNDFFGFVSLPASDRGYAKNEIVAAVVELYVPKNTNPADDFGSLVFGGDNVSLNVTDNDGGKLIASNVASPDTFTLADNELSRGVSGLSSTSNKTYKWLFFAKVTDDDASLFAKLVDKGGNSGFDSDALTVSLDGISYTVTKAKNDGEAGTYTIAGDGNTIVIYVDKNYKSTGMSINSKNLGVNTKGELGIVSGATIDTTSDDYKDVMDVYEDVVVDVFGMDYFLIGNYVRDSYFEDLVSADTIIATVDIEPWTAYVSVPENVVVDPPKTGDAASIMGFVMVALSGAGAVALKKRG
ncbi:MAG: hypothetical protein AAGU32_00180 [Bacillota bacterium]